MSLDLSSRSFVGDGSRTVPSNSSNGRLHTTATTATSSNSGAYSDTTMSPTYCWEKISYFYHTTRKPIHVLVSYDADAAAASLTFTSLLKSSLIDFSMQPVENYEEELRTIIEHTNLEQDYARSDPEAPLVDELFLLVGLGGTVPLPEYFDFARHVVIVLDANRPFHLANLRADESRLLVWGAAEIRREVDVFFREQRERELRGALRRQRRRRQRQRNHHHRRHRHDAGAQQQRGEEEEQQSRAKRRRKDTAAADRNKNKKQDQAQTVLGEDGEEDDEDEVSSSDGHSFAFSSSASSSHLSDDEEGSEDDDDSLFSDDDDDDGLEADEVDVPLHLSQEELIAWRDGDDAVPPYMQRLYAAIDSAGRSCAVEAYDLAVLLHRFQNSFLWHAAVGVCDLLQRRKIDYGQYLVAMRPLHDAVALQRHNGGNYNNNNAALEEREGVNVPSAHRRRNSTHMLLQNIDEEQLYLLRHSSLWDAIWYHPLTASVLGLHHVEEGEGFLSQLLASRCGIARERARQPWRELPYEVQQDCLPPLLAELQHILQKKASFSAVPCQVRGLSRTVGYSTEVSTFDACALFGAVVAAVPSDALYVVENLPQLERDAGAAAAVVKTRLREHQRTLFWRARDVLDVDPNDKLFRYAIQEAFTLQRAVAGATAALLQPGMVQSTRGVHYAQPGELAKTTTALESFTSVYRLQPLATRLLFTLTVERGVSRYTQMVRPLLLSCLVPRPRAPAPTSADHSILAAPAAAAAAAAAAASRGTGDSAEAEYLVLLEHEGATDAGLAPLPAVGRFKECVSDSEEFVVLPRPCWTQPRCVVVEGRETAAHVAELMHLKSLEPWRPRQEEEAQQRRYSAAAITGDDDDHHRGDDDDDDDGDHEHDTEDEGH